MTAIKRLCLAEFSNEKYADEKYKDMVVFIDCNPSFSIYTQMALVSADKLVIPMMADFSSLEGLKGLFMLLYGKYPSAAVRQYARNRITFDSQAKSFGLQLPFIYEFVFNNFTSNSGVATAYDSIRTELLDFCYKQFTNYRGLFAVCSSTPTSFDEWASFYVSDIKDFHTAGKVSSSLGIPMFRLPNQSKYTMPDGTAVNLPVRNYPQALENINTFVNKIR